MKRCYGIKFSDLRAAASATKADANGITDVAVILYNGNRVRTRTVMHGNWLRIDKDDTVDAVIYASAPMRATWIAQALTRKRKMRR